MIVSEMFYGWKRKKKRRFEKKNKERLVGVALHPFLTRLKRLMLFFLAVWFMGFFVFLSYIPIHLIDSHTHTDAIVVLTGGKDRLKTGFSLLSQAFAPILFVSGVNSGENLKSLMRSQEEISLLKKNQRHLLKERTVLGYEAQNTRGNAGEINQWTKKNHIQSIRLVTSAYHMPRSLLELEGILPHTRIIPHPVIGEAFGQDHWWQNSRILLLTISEYTKYILAWIRIHGENLLD